MAQETPTRIAVDAMGGDRAPLEIVRGALAAVQREGIHAILVGREEAIRDALKSIQGHGQPPSGVEIHHADRHIAMDERPAAAVRHKPDASICVAAQLVKSGTAQALVTAGHTGAATAASLTILKRITGIDRPGLTLVLPTITGGRVVMLDVGANVDSKPANLLQFAQMGSLYARLLLGVERPRVGLMSIGEENTKGNELTKATFQLLSESNLNFVGNVEGRDVISGNLEVVACDGFVGNVMIKGAEGCATFFIHSLRQALNSGWLARLGTLLLRKNLQRLKATMDWSEYGGALLLGVNGVSIITHGDSDAKGILNSIRVARQSVEGRIVEQIRETLQPVASAKCVAGANGADPESVAAAPRSHAANQVQAIPSGIETIS